MAHKKVTLDSLSDAVQLPEIVERLARIKLFLLDLDGTFYLGNRILEGSMDFIRALSETGRDFLFLTNNSSRNSTFYAEKISRMGCPIGPDKVFTSGEATAIYIKKLKPHARLYVVGTEYLKDDFRKAGLQVIEMIQEDARPDFVILGFDTTLNYEKLCNLCDLVTAGIPYIATHPDFVCPVEGGFIPDAGSFIELVRAATGKTPDVVIGKPNSLIIQAVMEKTGLPREQIAMIGDRLYTDIAVGDNAGITSILVLTGETSRTDLESSDIRPDMVFGSLGDMVPYLGYWPRTGDGSQG